MKIRIKPIKNRMLASAIPLAIIFLCAVGIVIFLGYYFQFYIHPYAVNEIIDLSEGWQYSTDRIGTTPLENLRSGPRLQAGETMTMFRTLDTELPEAAIMIRANHQVLSVYLDEAPLYVEPELAPGQNPGMSVHFVLLPEDYLHKTLTIELMSPYANYSGRTSPIMMGTIPSLGAWATSQSAPPLIFMAMCLLVGLFITSLTFVQTLKGFLQWQNLAIGVFAVIWGLYYVCTEYIALQVFPPVMASSLSLGLYYTFQAPLALYFYFSCKHYRQWMLPAAIIHTGFALIAPLLQLFGVVNLPELVNLNNVLLAGLAYTAVLAVLEAVKQNWMMILSSPFLIIAYASMLYNFHIFYTREGVVPYTYRGTYLILILIVLICNMQRFFNRYYRKLNETEVLTLHNRLAKESYAQVASHLQQAGALKHEIKNHIVALQAYLDSGRYEEARHYLAGFAKQSYAVTEAVYHENFLVNSAANKLLHLAKEHGIEVVLELTGSPTNIAEHDLYSLLSNILNNALEASAAVPEGGIRFITLAISRYEPYFTITCKNSRAGEIIRAGGNLKTTKKESGHGYGLWSIEQIVDAYDGLMDIDFDENTFTLIVALKDW